VNPLQHELRLDRTPLEERGADPQHERRRRREADLPAEGLAVARRLPVEPLVETLRPGNDDAVGRDAVQIDRFLFLCRVPDEHAVGRVADERLARQVIPAPDAETGRNAQCARRLHVFDLRRSEIDQRRQQHDVGVT
jgi:hypothetical protein